MTYDKTDRPYLIRASLRKWFNQRGGGGSGAILPQFNVRSQSDSKINLNNWVMLLIAGIIYLIWSHMYDA